MRKLPTLINHDRSFQKMYKRLGDTKNQNYSLLSSFYRKQSDVVSYTKIKDRFVVRVSRFVRTTKVSSRSMVFVAGKYGTFVEKAVGGATR